MGATDRSIGWAANAARARMTRRAATGSVLRSPLLVKPGW
jgi:hypothetical protein